MKNDINKNEVFIKPIEIIYIDSLFFMYNIKYENVSINSNYETILNVLFEKLIISHNEKYQKYFKFKGSYYLNIYNFNMEWMIKLPSLKEFEDFIIEFELLLNSNTFESFLRKNKIRILLND